MPQQLQVGGKSAKFLLVACSAVMTRCLLAGGAMQVTGSDRRLGYPSFGTLAAYCAQVHGSWWLPSRLGGRSVTERVSVSRQIGQ